MSWWNWRADLRQIWPQRLSETAGVAGSTLRILRLRRGQRWREDVMPKWEVILAWALSLRPVTRSREQLYKLEQEPVAFL
jgi:hypothetical protein